MIVFQKIDNQFVNITVKDPEKDIAYCSILVSRPQKDPKNEGKTTYGTIERIQNFGIPHEFIEEVGTAVHEAWRVSRGFLNVE